jgi:hypothetical protein
VPAALADDVRQRAAATRAALAASEYDIIGDLDDLIPDPSAFEKRPPRKVRVSHDEVDALVAEVRADAERTPATSARKARALLGRLRTRRGAG